MNKEDKKERGEISRRRFLRNAGLLAGGVAIGSTALLAACGSSDDAAGTETSTQTSTVTVSRYACLWCGETFSDRDGLILHISVNHPGKGFGPIPVAIMLSAIDDREQLKKRADELIAREFFVSILAGGLLGSIGDDYVRELWMAGFDIASQVRVDANMPYSEKLSQSRAAKEELELLLGARAKSYGPSDGFIIDKDTVQIISELGGGYIHVSSGITRHPEYALEPELEPGLPEDVSVAYIYQQPIGIYNRSSDLLDRELLCMTGANCDGVAQSELTGPQWVEFEKSLIERRIKDGKPLTLTFHCNMDVRGKAPSGQWFDAFVQILDYLSEKDAAGEVRVMSFADLANRYFPGT
jgi:hypothetical protein